MRNEKQVKTEETINTENTAMAIVENKSTEVARNENQLLETFDLTKGIPNMEDLVVVPLNLMNSYWTPQDKGETKRLLFDRIETVDYVNEETGETKSLVCAFFLECTGYGTKDAKVKSISNGSKRLVGMVKSKGIKQFMGIQITYLGKKRNVKNEWSSDDWDVFPLKLKV